MQVTSVLKCLLKHMMLTLTLKQRIFTRFWAQGITFPRAPGGLCDVELAYEKRKKENENKASINYYSN